MVGEVFYGPARGRDKTSFESILVMNFKAVYVLRDLETMLESPTGQVSYWFGYHDEIQGGSLRWDEEVVIQSRRVYEHCSWIKR